MPFHTNDDFVTITPSLANDKSLCLSRKEGSTELATKTHHIHNVCILASSMKHMNLQIRPYL